MREREKITKQSFPFNRIAFYHDVVADSIIIVLSFNTNSQCCSQQVL